MCFTPKTNNWFARFNYLSVMIIVDNLTIKLSSESVELKIYKNIHRLLVRNSLKSSSLHTTLCAYITYVLYLFS